MPKFFQRTRWLLLLGTLNFLLLFFVFKNNSDATSEGRMYTIGTNLLSCVVGCLKVPASYAVRGYLWMSSESNMADFHLNTRLVDRVDTPARKALELTEHAVADSRINDGLLHRRTVDLRDLEEEEKYEATETEKVVAIRHRSFSKGVSEEADYYEHPGLISEQGRIGYINGMGVPKKTVRSQDLQEVRYSIEDHCEALSKLFCSSHAIHAIHLPPCVKDPDELIASPLPVKDILRYLSVQRGEISRAMLLLVQDWITYLSENPEKKYLQICTSEATAHVKGALKLLEKYRPDFVKHMRVIALTPAAFIDMKAEGLEVHHFYKKEDVVLAIAGEKPVFLTPANTTVVEHNNIKGNFPHNFSTGEYQKAVGPFIARFLQTGSIVEK